MINEILVPNISFKMKPDGSIELVNAAPKTTTLSVEHTVDWSLLRDENQAAVEEYIRNELARKLADKMIEEDLLQIQTSDDPMLMEKKVRATVKFIQE